jgi:hypothetical protein
VATPDPLFGTSVPLNYATLTQFLHGGGKTGSIKCLWAQILWNTTWQVASSVDSNGITAGMLAWVTNHLVLTLPAGYTRPPVALATGASQTAYRPVVEALSPTSIHVYFLDAAGSIVTTVGVRMTCTLVLVGI